MALKRVMRRSRAEMTLSKLDAEVGWLERHRLADHIGLLADDPHYAWSARQRRERVPPVGRADGRPRGAPRRPRPTTRQAEGPEPAAATDLLRRNT